MSIADRPPLLTTFTFLELTTLTMRVWPLVPGLSSSTFMKTGFLFAGALTAAVAMEIEVTERNPVADESERRANGE